VAVAVKFCEDPTTSVLDGARTVIDCIDTDGAVGNPHADAVTTIIASKALSGIALLRIEQKPGCVDSNDDLNEMGIKFAGTIFSSYETRAAS
jgi:hypothetical protein